MITESTKKIPLVEVCVGSLADAQAAATAGADRLELCSATEIGGLTPSAGLVEQIIETVRLPVAVMIRPRPGGFCYSNGEFKVAVRDAMHALESGATGIVFGFLLADGQIDEARCHELVQLASQKQTVFHRAFDFTQHPMRACEQLVELGVTRLLTSGQKKDALAGATLIRDLVKQTQGQLEVMPGGGIRSHNVQAVLQQTGCSQIHIGASSIETDHSIAVGSEIDFCCHESLEQGCYRKVKAALVASVVKTLETHCN